MFSTGVFNPTPLGFQFPVQQQHQQQQQRQQQQQQQQQRQQQQPATSIYQSQYNGFNPQGVQQFPQVPPRGQSLPASNRQYPPLNGNYGPRSTRRYDQYPPPSQPFPFRRNRESKKVKKQNKQRIVSPDDVPAQGLYSDTERREPSTDRNRSRSPSVEDRSKKDESSHNEPTSKSESVEKLNNEPSKDEATTEQQSEVNEKRKSRSKKKKHYRHNDDENSKNNFQQQPPFYGQFQNEFPPSINNRQQGFYNGYNSIYDELNRRDDIHHKQTKHSKRFSQNDDQQKVQFNRYSHQPFAGMQPPFRPFQPGFFGTTTPFKAPQPWLNNGPAEQEIRRLRSHIHTLEGELHKLEKKLNKATLNNNETSTHSDTTTNTNRQSKHETNGSSKQTPAIVELNSTTTENNRELTSKKQRNQLDNDVNSKQEQHIIQQSNGISEESIFGQNEISTVNGLRNQSPKQQIPFNRESSRSIGNQLSETESRTSSISKNPREQTAAQLAHAAAAYVHARQQVPPPPPVQQPYSNTRKSVNGNIRYSNGPYEQQHPVSNANYNQSNNNEIFANDDKRRNRSVEKILDAFERFYLHSGRTAAAAPMKVKYIPEENNSRQNEAIKVHHQL